MTVTEAATETKPVAAAPTPKRRPGLNPDTLALSAMFVALFAFAAAIIGVGVAFRAIDEHQAIVAASGTGGSAATTVQVSLSEFMIMPKPLSAPVGSTLEVVNDGTVEHNLSVGGLTTPNLASGERAELDIGGLAPGTYPVTCAIPGHKEAGMETTLTIG